MTPPSPLLPEVRWDRPESLWRVVVGGDPITGEDGQPMGWPGFNDAYDVMFKLERAACAVGRWW